MDKRTDKLLIAPIIIFAIFVLWAISLFAFGSNHWPQNRSVSASPPAYFMTGMSLIGDPAPVFVFCLLLVVFRRSRKTIAFPVCAAMIASSIAYDVLKVIFSSDRSDIIKLLTETNYGFPAGHALNSAALYTMLIFLTFRYLKKPAFKIMLSFLFVFLMIAIGLSRIYLGIHKPVDVLGGWMIGIAIAVMVYFIWKARRAKIAASK